MNRLLFVFAALQIGCCPALAENRPITGKVSQRVEPVDKAIKKFMDRIECRAGAVAISKNGKLLYSCGFGWRDQAKTTPTPPNTLFRIASVSKPITAAIIEWLINAMKLSRDTRVFPFLKLEPAVQGKKVDPRIFKITVSQLLEHSGGWDREMSYDPMFQVKKIRNTLKLKRPVTAMDIVRYMMTEPLQFDPGERKAYSNFGYCVLGRVIEKAAGMPYEEALQKVICRPLKIIDIKLARSKIEDRDPREVWYPPSKIAFSIEVMDAHGGLIASAPALCRFMDHYWISGKPRMPGQEQNWTFFGALPGTTAMVRQRPDGFNNAVLLNGRRSRNRDDNILLKKLMDEALESLAQN